MSVSTKKTTKKVTAPPVAKKYNKENTKQKFIDAIGKILKYKGFSEIKVNTIAEYANADKKLIYTYFGSVDNLVDTYIKQYDYWNIVKTKKENKEEKLTAITQDVVSRLLKNDWEYLEQNPEMQQIVLWGLSQKSKTLKKVGDDKEVSNKNLIQLSDKHFKGSGVNFNAINAILVAAINYMVLHAKTNKSTISDIDISSKNGKAAIAEAIEQILSWSFSTAKKKK